MAKLIIYIAGNPAFEGVRKGDFFWNVEQKCYIWKNKVYDEVEFNGAVAGAMAHYPKRLRPLVKIVEFSDSAKEITVAAAEEVMQRFAPHRLKAKPGPKPREEVEEPV